MKRHKSKSKIDKTSKNEKVVIGACGVCCSTCRFHYTLGCKCSAGTEEVAKRKVKTNWADRGVLCLVCKCAVEKNISYCSKDCDEFPCDKFREWNFPYSETYLKMCERRKKDEKK